MRIPYSEECCKSELDLMSVPPTQTEIEDSVWDDIKPHPTFSDGVITFDITGDSSNYLDLADTELYVKLILQKKKKDSSEYTNAVFEDSGTGVNEVKGSLIAPINNIIHSLFSQIQIYLNGREVENSNANYMYKAYLANLLSYGSESKKSFLASEGYFKDTAGEMDNISVGTAAVTAGTCKNIGLKQRWNLFKDSQPVELRARLQADVFNMNRFLLSNVNVTVKLSRNKPEFYLMGTGDDHKIIVSDCFLRVRRVKISPSTMLKHAMALESTTAKYPIKRCVIKQFTLPYNASKASINGIHTGMF